MMFRLVILLTVVSAMTVNIQAASRLKSPSKHRFYLLSTYTPDDVSVSKQKFSNSYQNISKQGILVYRNGQTYSVLVPVMKIYNKGSANYATNGEKTLRELSQFLAYYDVDFMSFTGISFTEEAHEEAGAAAVSGLKGDYKKHRGMKTNLSRQPRKIAPRIIALKQTSKMVKAMKTMQKKMLNIGISVTTEIEKNSAFMKGISDNVNSTMSSAKSSLETASMIAQEIAAGSQDLGIYDDGAILIEFKKY